MVNHTGAHDEHVQDLYALTSSCVPSGITILVDHLDKLCFLAFRELLYNDRCPARVDIARFHGPRVARRPDCCCELRRPVSSFLLASPLRIKQCFPTSIRLGEGAQKLAARGAHH
jgi:hypothetical protein